MLFSSHETAHLFVILDPCLTIAHVCESIFPVTGLSSNEVMKQPIQNILVESPVNTQFLKSVALKQSSDDSESMMCELRSANGRAIPVSFSVQCICSEIEIIGYSCLGTQLRYQNGSAIAAPYLLRANEDPQNILERWNSLCPSEQELIMLIVNGVQNKVAASRMGVAIRTIESRRSSSMKKLGVRSVADLVRIYLAIHLI